MNRSIWPLVAILAIATSAWLLRWSSPVHVDKGMTVVVDRWTGDIWYSLVSQRWKITLDATDDFAPQQTSTNEWGDKPAK